MKSGQKVSWAHTRHLRRPDMDCEGSMCLSLNATQGRRDQREELSTFNGQLACLTVDVDDEDVHRQCPWPPHLLRGRIRSRR